MRDCPLGIFGDLLVLFDQIHDHCSPLGWLGIGTLPLRKDDITLQAALLSDGEVSCGTFNVYEVSAAHVKDRFRFQAADFAWS